MISKCTRDTVSSLSTRSFSAALPTRNTSPAITNSVPRCAPLITTSLQRLRLTVAGVASRRIRVPVRCSIVKWYRDHARAWGAPTHLVVMSGSPAGFLVWWIQREYLSVSAASVRGTRARRLARRRRRGRERAARADPAIGCASAVVPGPDHQGPARRRPEAARGPEARLPQEQEDRRGRPRRPLRRRSDVVELDRGRRARLLLHRGPRGERRVRSDAAHSRPRRAAQQVLRRQPVRPR